MSTDLVSTFEESLSALDLEWSHTTAENFHAAVDAAVELPAVGARLPFEELSLAETNVLVDPTPTQLEAAATGVTAVGRAIAEHGTLTIQSRPGGDEPVSLYPKRHVAVVRGSDIVADVPAAMDWLAGEFADGRDSAVFATGVSATGDMGAIVKGVHGPLEVHVIVVNDR